MIEDSYLVIQCRRGNREALRQVYEKYRGHLLIVAMALCHDTDLAEDAVQDTFVTFARNAASVRLGSRLRAYLATCAANRVRDLLRAQRRRESSPIDVPEACDEPVRGIVINEELERLSKALAKLPLEQREVIVLRTHSQMRFRTIAEMQGASVNTVKGRYRYGMQRLRTILDGESFR